MSDNEQELQGRPDASRDEDEDEDDRAESNERERDGGRKGESGGGPDDVLPGRTDTGPETTSKD